MARQDFRRELKTPEHGFEWAEYFGRHPIGGDYSRHGGFAT
jgi:hypothetical protein